MVIIISLIHFFSFVTFCFYTNQWGVEGEGLFYSWYEKERKKERKERKRDIISFYLHIYTGVEKQTFNPQPSFSLSL